MYPNNFEILGNKVLIRLGYRACETAEELFASPLFFQVVELAINTLKERQSRLLDVFGSKEINKDQIRLFIKTLDALVKINSDLVPNIVKDSEVFFKDKNVFNQLVEFIYNYWRSFDRFVICDAIPEDRLEQRPYRTFNNTIEQLTHLIRKVYRDIQENLTGNHPTIYRQVVAGAEAAAITSLKNIPVSDPQLEWTKDIPVISQILLCPPLILNPSSNKRKGQFARTEVNFIGRMNVDKNDWLCYPAKVGPLTILIYFHKVFCELGFSLANLFDLAQEEDLQKKPDAVYFFGIDPKVVEGLGEYPTVFYDDEKTDTLIGAVPRGAEFGYFGYLKKMVLTLHNIRMMKMGRLPYHGSLVKILLKGQEEVNVLFIGDTGAGKSETLEALRESGKDVIRDMVVIADDMGSLEIDGKGQIIGYGTETGAFLRIDDLNPGYAFGQLDRAVIMSPNMVNARIILPVTTYEELMRGCSLDYIFYLNNYEEIDEDHPIMERFEDVPHAIKVFRDGAVMSKGTTASTGLVHSYFANIFGPIQYRSLHDQIAQKYFEAFFDAKLFVGQMRTRLGIPGMEMEGPRQAAARLLELIRQ